MKRCVLITWTTLSVTVLFFTAIVMSQPSSFPKTRGAARQAMRDGNFRDAYDALRQLCLDPRNDDLVAADLPLAVQCLQRLNRVAETDALIEATVETHAAKWRLLESAADVYRDLPHFGFVVGGKLERGSRRGGGQYVLTGERDRVRSLQLMVQAEQQVATIDDKARAGQFYLNLADHLLGQRNYVEAWRLQYLTDLTVLPDFTESLFQPFSYSPGAPADEKGNPVYHTSV